MADAASKLCSNLIFLLHSRLRWRQNVNEGERSGLDRLEIVGVALDQLQLAISVEYAIFSNGLRYL
jgi:hypothetical protein